jgi:hypothetical protein
MRTDCKRLKTKVHRKIPDVRDSCLFGISQNKELLTSYIFLFSSSLSSSSSSSRLRNCDVYLVLGYKLTLHFSSKPVGRLSLGRSSIWWKESILQLRINKPHSSIFYCTVCCPFGRLSTVPRSCNVPGTLAATYLRASLTVTNTHVVSGRKEMWQRIRRLASHCPFHLPWRSLGSQVFCVQYNRGHGIKTDHKGIYCEVMR